MNYTELYHRNNETLLGADTGPQEVLEHHGIPGQKWGKQNGPPYPLSTKKHNSVTEGAEQKKKKRTLGEIIASRRKAKKEERDIEKFDKKYDEKKHKTIPEELLQGIKNKAVSSGDAKFVAKYRKFLTNAELEAAIKRVELDQKIRSLNAKDTKNFGDIVDSTTKWIDRGAKIYNYYADYTVAKDALRKRDITNRKAEDEIDKDYSMPRFGKQEKKK